MAESKTNGDGKNEEQGGQRGAEVAAELAAIKPQEESASRFDPARAERWAQINSEEWARIRAEQLPERCPALSVASGELSLDSVESGDSVGMNCLITEWYFSQKDDVEREAVARRLVTLKSRDAAPVGGEPRTTVMIPVAAHNEKPDLLRHTLEEVAGEDGADEDELFVYGNMPDNLPESQKAAARASMDAVVAEFRQSHPDITIRSMVGEYPEGQLNMNQVRFDAFDVIAFEGISRGYGFDHPVFMLDADMGHIDASTNVTMSGALTAADSRFMIVHPDMLWDVEGVSIPRNAVEVEAPEGLDDATRLAAVAEVSRLHAQDQLRREYDIPNARGEVYPEEAGSAIALGPAIMVGNFHLQEHATEMMGLQMAMIALSEEITEATRRAKPGVTEEVMAVANYYPEVRVSTSARRWEQVLRDWVTLPAGADASEYADNVRDWHLSGPTGLYNTPEQFGHTDAVRERNDVGPFNMPEEVREARMQEIVDAMLGPIDRSEEMVAVLERFGLPLPANWREGKGFGTYLATSRAQFED